MVANNSKAKYRFFSPLFKPVWGAIWSPDRILAEIENLLPELLYCANSGVRLLLLPFPDGAEPAVQQVMMSLRSRLFREGYRSTLVSLNLSLSIPDEPGSFDFVLVHNLSAHPQLFESFVMGFDEGPLVVASVPEQMTESLVNVVPTRIFAIEYGTEEQAAIDALRAAVFDGNHSEPRRDQNQLDLIAVADAADTSLPIGLVARAAGMSTDEVMESVRTNDIFREFEVGNDVKVSTASSILARRFLGLDREKITECLGMLLDAVETGDRNERLTIVNLFQSACALTSRQFGNNEILFDRSSITKLLEQKSGQIEKIVDSGKEIECILWGKLLESIGLFKKAAKLLGEGSHRFPENRKIQHALTRLCLEWSVYDPGKRTEARRQLEKSINNDPENPYVQHTAGVFLLKRGDVRDAVDYLGRAVELEEDLGELESQVFFTSSLVEALIEVGEFLKAEEKLDACASTEHSIYLLHSRAKLRYYTGKYDEARADLERLFEIRPNSVEGHTILGEMHSRRGHWASAERELGKSLKIDPQNVRVLRALADLESDRGDFCREMGAADGAESHFRAAERFIRRALEFEPENVWLLTTEAAILRRSKPASELKSTIERLRDLLEKFREIDQTRRYLQSALCEILLHCDQFSEIEEIVDPIPLGERSLAIKLVDLKLALRRNQWGEFDVNALEELERDVNYSRPKHELIRAYLSIADVWLRAEYPQKAVELAERALKLDSENVFATVKKAASLEACDEPENAAKERELAVELSSR